MEEVMSVVPDCIVTQGPQVFVSYLGRMWGPVWTQLRRVWRDSSLFPPA